MCSEKLKSLSTGFTELLMLEGYPVAVKLLKDVKGFESIRKPANRLAICQIFSQARYVHRTILATEKEVSGCWGGLVVTGLAEIPKDVQSGERYAGWTFQNPEVARKAVEALPKFDVGEYKAVLVSPLDICPTDPDVVLIFGNAARMLALSVGYLYDKGGLLEFSTVGIAGCGYAVVTPMKTKKPTVILPCNGMRLLALPNDTELVFSLPFELAEEILEGVKFLKENGGPRIPTFWQHINWEPLPTISYITKPEGPGPVWLKRKQTKGT